MSKVDELKALVPELVSQIREFTVLYTTEGTELDNIYSAVDVVRNQFFVDTADFTLERWEKELGIEVNNSYDTSYRQSRIKSKLRGQGTITVKLIENVAESFVNGDVEIIENNPLYSFTVKFIGPRGIPPNVDDLKAAIEDIKPAHLVVVFEYRYLIWDELDARAITWDVLDALALTWDNFETGGWLYA